MSRETAAERFARLNPTPPEITLTIAGEDRHWVADALYVSVREHEAAEALRGRRITNRQRQRQSSVADRLRNYADQVLP